ncbi:hypothetical protein BVRB_3g050540 [Beta vulgaris subsp. vulgaris]|uniref:Thaumatin-like protein n=1 Tax=Beta vulgaris subsp. vulgaris TaxID=3555 RepID=A0A0J8CWT9_BETVV|nr:hypothetical protein BVRB_3g050540 [Beta vulgaris subsp. vulgaris]
MLNKILLLSTLIIFLLFPSIVSSTFTITNNCPFTIWPGTLSGSGTPPLSSTGFQLDTGKTMRLEASPGWSGRIWARTGCQFDQTGAGKCLTGDCGGKLECDGSGATPPASLFEITLGQGNNKDFYDVSIVDGYNLPLVAWPTGVNGAACNATGCISDINMDQYCCSGQFANPTTCRPSYYAHVFKRACPRAYSYAFDDGTSTFTCKAYNYAVVFCPKSAAMTNKPNGGTAMSPPSVPYTSPPAGYGAPPSVIYNSPPVGYGAPPSVIYNSPPVGYSAPPSVTYNSPPVGYGAPPSVIDNSPPVGYGAPPSVIDNSPPSFTYSSPTIGYNTPPSSSYVSPPTTKHSFGASKGEVSNSNTILPYAVYILLAFSLLLLG